MEQKQETSWEIGPTTRPDGQPDGGFALWHDGQPELQIKDAADLDRLYAIILSAVAGELTAPPTICHDPLHGWAEPREEPPCI